MPVSFVELLFRYNVVGWKLFILNYSFGFLFSTKRFGFNLSGFKYNYRSFPLEFDLFFFFSKSKLINNLFFFTLSSVIDDKPLRFRGEVYHPYHFNCTACGIELNSDAREVKSRPGYSANEMVK